MTTWSGEVSPGDVDPTPVGDDPDPISHQTVSVAKTVDAQGRVILQVRLAPETLRELEEGGSGIVVQVLPDEHLS